MAKEDSIEYRREDILQALRYLNQIVVSLDRLGSTYSDVGKRVGDELTADFVTNWRVTQKLAQVRRVLSEPFSDELDPNDMDELERQMQAVIYWSVERREPPNDFPMGKRRQRR